ncbi:DUF739 family protein [Emergencia sp. 1XD21-10]|uniref:DUF739 family protein n=1 Tax=Emergencia sp. 1XD21-10 TaxID=2304569 RepID=UPI00137A26BA|nr:DUF739 family protein [Emergencia sp. 1XD21-10]NCE99626.1 DUF739 family protein [Emergencia sp. 1XD21-10]
MSFDYSKLRGKIVEKYGTNAKFAKDMGLSERSLSLKLNGKVFWKQNEICTAAELLGIKNEDIQSFFFTKIVQNF